MPPYSDAIPALLLTDEASELLASEADRLVTDALQVFVDFHDDQQRRLHPSHYASTLRSSPAWRQVRSHDATSVFQEVSPPHVSHLPQIIALGHVHGRIEDALFGALATTETEARVRAACCEESLVDTKLLATLIEPSIEHPLRHLAIRWNCYEDESSSSLFQRKHLHDAVLLQSIGFATTSTGERVGYVLQHSVAFASVPLLERQGIHRAPESTVAIFRQDPHGMLEIFIRSFANADLASSWMPSRRRYLRAVSTRAASWCRLPLCGQMRKLAHYLKRSRVRDLQHPVLPPPGPAKHCGVCDASLTSARWLGAVKRCVICYRPVCTRCSAERKLYVLGATDVHCEKARLCHRCHQHIRRAKVTTIARRELHAQLPPQYQPTRKTAQELQQVRGSYLERPSRVSEWTADDLVRRSLSESEIYEEEESGQVRELMGKRRSVASERESFLSDILTGSPSDASWCPSIAEGSYQDTMPFSQTAYAPPRALRRRGQERDYRGSYMTV